MSTIQLRESLGPRGLSVDCQFSTSCNLHVRHFFGPNFCEYRVIAVASLLLYRMTELWNLNNSLSKSERDVI